MSRETQDRLTNVVFVVLSGALVAVSAWVTPSEKGIGTHERLGLPPCHFYKWTGVPCFSCGMTTSWSHMAHLHPLRSVKAQPMGAVLFLASVAAGLASLVFLVRGGTVERRLAGRGTLLSSLFFGGMLAAWIYKIVMVRTAGPP
jgi:hypothetical protein